MRKSPREDVPWSDESGCPVNTPHDHAMLVAVCEQVGEQERVIREYFRTWRERVGEDGVIVIGHPHPAWLGSQISPSNIFYQWNDHRDEYRAEHGCGVAGVALYVMSIALEEGIDFMSDSSYGLEMTSPALFAAMDLPYIRAFSTWTHEHGSLFWYHNCGFTRQLIADGTFNTLGVDVLETIAPPPEGDNELAEARRALDRRICSKGNLNLQILRDGVAGSDQCRSGCHWPGCPRVCAHHLDRRCGAARDPAGEFCRVHHSRPGRCGVNQLEPLLQAVVCRPFIELHVDPGRLPLVPCRPPPMNPASGCFRSLLPLSLNLLVSGQSSIRGG